MRTRGARQTLDGGLLLAGRYRVERMLGRGGVATVYAVYDEQLGERLALKYLTLEKGPRDEQALGLLQREYHTLEQIAHPGIVRVFDFGLQDDAAFYTMELLDGQDLCDAPPMSWQRACEVLCQTASALAMLHARRLIHRDVSHRNVRLTTQAGAKLIDFGGMMPMGFALEIIGTPPFLSPEAVHGDPLDHRADLYSLGALAYYLLAHQHAYPVRSVAELKQAWAAGEARPLAELVPDLPAPLSRLVMSAIAREPAARPRNMAELIDALRAVAGLPPMAEPEVARAYLTNPKLIAADGVLRRLSQGLTRALTGRGGALLIEGTFGSGKSRILQELVRSAKLGGAHVVQLRAHGERRPAYALARDLLDAVVADVPQAAELLGPERRAVLGWLLPAFAAQRPADGGEPSPPARPENVQEVRARVQAELIAFLHELGARVRFAIAVDDAHACDDASLALLAALAGAHAAGSPALLCTLRPAEACSETLHALQARANDRVALRAFGLEETQQLVESLFGGTARSRHVASWLHARTGGNPLECIELARALVELGAAQYADGAWRLPETLPEGVPHDLTAALRARVAALEPDARALAELLAVYGEPASLALCGECAGLPPQALFAALDRLVSSELVVARGDDYALQRSGIRDALLRALPDERRRQLNQRLGEALLARGPENRGALLAVAHRLLAGSEPLRGVELLEQALPSAERLIELGEAVVPALELALSVCEARREPAARALRLRVHLVTCAFVYDRRLLPHVDALLARFYVDGAIDDWTRGDPSLAGLFQAVRLADQRYRDADVATRGLAPLESLITFATTVAATLGVAVLDQDFERIERLAAMIAPFATLPKENGLALTHDLVMAVRDSARGHVLSGDAMRAEMFRNLKNPLKYQGVSEEARKSVIATQLHAMAVRRAAFDPERALAMADEIDALGLRMYENAAQQVRMLVELQRGDQRAAAEHASKLEALSLQGPGRQTEVWLLGYLVSAYASLGDVMGLKHTAERLAELVPRNLGYRVALCCALGAYYRERAQLRESEVVLERGLALAPVGQHAYYARITHELCRTLVAAREHARAVALAEESYAALAGTLEEPEVVALRLWPSVTESEIALGRAEDARARLLQLLAFAERTKAPFARVATVHEALARIALAAGERARFEQHVERAAECYRTAGNPALLARLASFVDELTRERGVPSIPLRNPDTSSVATVEDRPEQPYARLLAAVDAGERARRALAIILEQCGVQRGALCLLGAEGMRVAADVGLTAVPAALLEALPGLLDQTRITARGEREREPPSWRAPDGSSWSVIALSFLGGAQLQLVGAALLPELARRPDPASLGLIAHALHQAGELGIPHSLDALLAL